MAAIPVPSNRSTSSPFSRRFDSLLKSTTSTSSDFRFPCSSTEETNTKVLDESNKRKGLDESKKQKGLDESKKRKFLTSSSSGELAVVAVNNPMVQAVQRQTQFMDLPMPLIYNILSKLPTNQAAAFPFIVSNSLMHHFFEDPSVVDKSIVTSVKPPLKLHIDWEVLHTNLVSLGPYPNENPYPKLVSFVKGLFEFHRVSVTCLDMRSCRLNLRNPFTSLSMVSLFKVTILSIEGLVRNLPVLETLFLKGSIIPTWFSLCAENSSLTFLMMDRCFGHREGIHQDMLEPFCRFYIRLPSLKTFMYKGMVSNPFDINCEGLEKAGLRFFTTKENNFIGREHVVYLLLKRMRKVKELHICNSCLQNIREVHLKDSFQPTLTPFSNLELLYLNTRLEDGVTELACLLQSAPMLKRICLDIGLSCSLAPGEYTTNHWENVAATFEYLVFFQINSFIGFQRELDLLAFILRSSPKLLEVKVGMVSNASFEMVFRRDVLKKVQAESRGLIENLRKDYEGVEIKIVDDE